MYFKLLTLKLTVEVVIYDNLCAQNYWCSKSINCLDWIHLPTEKLKTAVGGCSVHPQPRLMGAPTALKLSPASFMSHYLLLCIFCCISWYFVNVNVADVGWWWSRDLFCDHTVPVFSLRQVMQPGRQSFTWGLRRSKCACWKSSLS